MVKLESQKLKLNDLYKKRMQFNGSTEKTILTKIDSLNSNVTSSISSTINLCLDDLNWIREQEEEKNL